MISTVMHAKLVKMHTQITCMSKKGTLDVLQMSLGHLYDMMSVKDIFITSSVHFMSTFRTYCSLNI